MIPEGNRSILLGHRQQCSMSNCFLYLSAYPTEKTAIMITMAIRRLIQQRTKEKAKNKPNHVYVDREGGRASEGERQRERD